MHVDSGDDVAGRGEVPEALSDERTWGGFNTKFGLYCKAMAAAADVPHVGHDWPDDSAPRPRPRPRPQSREDSAHEAAHPDDLARSGNRRG